MRIAARFSSLTIPRSITQMRRAFPYLRSTIRRMLSMVDTSARFPSNVSQLNENPVANFSLATNERFKERNDQWQDRTEWHSIVAWKRLAEIVGEYVAKGSKLYVEGKIQTSSWEDRQSGERKYRTEIVAREARWCRQDNLRS
ncbi:MAG TPA: single-stranded DNA-binding protein [Candidatus Polarisedimenticolia bacterium]|nr:single-stranded DNA-binding protein [Candidatus Polarisedimenticolia bacterium]